MYSRNWCCPHDVLSCCVEFILTMSTMWYNLLRALHAEHHALNILVSIIYYFAKHLNHNLFVGSFRILVALISPLEEGNKSQVCMKCTR